MKSSYQVCLPVTCRIRFVVDAEDETDAKFQSLRRALSAVRAFSEPWIQDIQVLLPSTIEIEIHAVPLSPEEPRRRQELASRLSQCRGPTFEHDGRQYKWIFGEGGDHIDCQTGQKFVIADGGRMLQEDYEEWRRAELDRLGIDVAASSAEVGPANKGRTRARRASAARRRRKTP